jgi:DNA-directed RNA polymerase subunit RPC12/RpoP
MIEIINTVPHPSVTKEVVCHHCGVTLRYTPNDVMTRIESDYTGCRDRVNYIQCPKCSTQITVT